MGFLSDIMAAHPAQPATMTQPASTPYAAPAPYAPAPAAASPYTAAYQAAPTSTYNLGMSAPPSAATPYAPAPASPFMSSSGGGFQSNPYLEKSIGDALGDTTRAYNLTTAPAYTSAMVRSGSFGNSGVQQLQGEAERQLQTSLGRQANDMRSGNYQFDQQFDRGVYNDKFNQNQQSMGMGLSLLDYQNRMNQQNLGFGTQIQNTPMNYYQGFANTANGIGQGFGTTSGSSTAQGSPLMGALGGAQLGNKLWNQWSSPSYGSVPYNADTTIPMQPGGGY